MEKLKKEQIEKIKKYGLFTGSRCFGKPNDKSDYDFVLLKEHFEQIIDIKNETSQQKDLFDQYHKSKEYTEDETNFVSLKYSYKPKYDTNEYIINLIIVDSPVFFDAWKFATECFKINMGLLDKLNKSEKSRDILKLFFENLKYSYVKTHQKINGTTEKRPIGTPRLWGL